jgi:hypothetical protein
LFESIQDLLPSAYKSLFLAYLKNFEVALHTLLVQLLC